MLIIIRHIVLYYNIIWKKLPIGYGQKIFYLMKSFCHLSSWHSAHIHSNALELFLTLVEFQLVCAMASRVLVHCTYNRRASREFCSDANLCGIFNESCQIILLAASIFLSRYFQASTDVCVDLMFVAKYSHRSLSWLCLLLMLWHIHYIILRTSRCPVLFAA